ncbi:MAG: hypothetical protein ACFFDN_14895 [Candidatus Hodarchaeota archaeon]
MGLIKLLNGIIKRLALTNKELESISQEESDEHVIKDKLTLNVQTFTKMMFNDFFQIEGYSDETYRKLFLEINNILKENPVLAPALFAHLKRFSDYSRAMHKNLRKYLKEQLGDLLEEKTDLEPSDDSLV